MTRKSEAVPRWATVLEDPPASIMSEFKSTAAALEIDLHPWQLEVLKAIAARLADGATPVLKDVMLTVPRQQGKTIIATVVIITMGRLLTGGIMVYCAQTRLDSRDRLVAIGDMAVRAGVNAKVNIGAGNERIYFQDTGTELRIMSPNERGGHGWTIDLVVLDEVFAIDPIVMSGIVPARVARPASQMVAISTAGTVESELFLDLQAKGREAVENPDSTFGYFEWSAPDDVDVFDPETWWDYLPSLGRSVAPDAIRSAMDTLAPHQFERAFGNRTVRVDQPVVPVGWWQDTADPTKVPERLVLAVEVGKGPSSAAIAGAWDSHGRPHVELIDYAPGESTRWVGPRLLEMIDQWRIDMIVIDKGGPAGVVFADVKAIGERHGIPVRVIYPREMGAACGGLYEDLRSGEITHGVSEALDLAVVGARQKSIGDVWVFDRRTSVSDIAPLNAIAEARFGLVETRSVPRPGIY